MLKHNGLVVLCIWLVTGGVIVMDPIVGILFACVAMMTTAAMLEYARQESKAQTAMMLLQQESNAYNHKVKRNQKKRRAKQTGKNLPGARIW